MDKELTTLFTGQNRIRLESVDSTNNYLSEFLKSELLPEGSVIQAMLQTAGKGQAGQEWRSEEGKNLLLSFVFYPSFLAAGDIFLLSKTFSLGVFNYFMSRLGSSVSIKWPNDIYWQGLKLSGMLIENSISGSGISHSILGLGLNLNQLQFDSSLPNPVSLRQLLKTELDLDAEFCLLCTHLEECYLRLKKGDYKQLTIEYDQHLYHAGEWHFYRLEDKTIRGKITGVNSDGLICMELEDGTTTRYNLKEIKFL